MFKNIIANFFGRFWSILSTFLFIPLYIKYLGFENYSIISFTIVIAGFMAILDSGLTSTLSREFARTDHDLSHKKRVFFSLESIYLIITLLVIVTVFFSSSFIANNWLNIKSGNNISYLIKIISIDTALQMLLRFYMGGLLGLQKQVLANGLQVIWGVFRNGVVLLIIMFYPSIEFFFIWQGICTIVFTILYRIYLFKEISEDSKFRINLSVDKEILKSVYKFAGGMLLISLVSGVNTQLDKFVISKLFPIEQLGNYSLAISLAMGIVVIINPISMALLPKFTSLFSSKANQEIISVYKSSSLFTSIIISTFSSVLAVFSKDLIWIWTGNSQIAENNYIILSIMAFAYSFMAFAVIPYNMAIANGYTTLNNKLGLLSILITIPFYILVASKYGIEGIAAVFCAVQLLITILYLIFINKKFLNIQPFGSFVIKSIVFPLLFSFSLSILYYYILSRFDSDIRILSLILIGLGACIIFAFNYLIFVPKAEKKIIQQKIKFRK
ncbi:oligosaccharide flippase family protein [Chryseobacterium defluvii]|uniref:O-antigen/teichoic acid export membrane protein n=1 Tax=Chryseobacterium defluvii TaxID=160396 RepID=A0A495SPI8_9FLAO|nr:oligosaccharide flippase family protein [Chryseobacterium defluvii]RKT01340.1 O-antigen/teichoic acid export membrane protein [Chryseobacterium defluvii]